MLAKGTSSSSTLPEYSSRGPLNRAHRPWFISLLVAVKMSSSLAIFMLAEYLRKITHSTDPRYPGHLSHSFRVFVEASSSTSVVIDVPSMPRRFGCLGRWSPIFQVLAIIQMGAGIMFYFVQKPLSSTQTSPLTRSQWVKVVRHSLVLIVFLVVWISGLILTGPFRTIFLSSHYDYTLAAMISGLFMVKAGPRLRGGVLFIAGVLLELLFDYHFSPQSNQSGKNIHEEEKKHWSKNAAGVVTLVVYLLFKLALDALSKNLASDIGGLKRLHSLSTIVSGAILWVAVLFDILSGGTPIPLGSAIPMLVFVTLFDVVLNYYIDSMCMKRMETWKVARIGTIASHMSALLYTLLWISLDDVPQLSTILSFTLISLATWSLTGSERASGGGNLIGYTVDGLPLFNFQSHFSGESTTPLWKNFLALVSSFYRQVLEDRMSRRILYYFLLSLSFTLVEFSYGIVANSLGLISDGFHMLFDAMALFIGLCASVVCRWKPSSNFPFGYSRIEVLSGFMNGFFLLIAAGGIFFEAVTRLFNPPEINAHQTLTISVIGLFVNLIGMFVFRNTMQDQVRIHENANIRGVFLHVLADTLGSIGVIISSVLIKQYGLLIADPICSIAIACIIVKTVWPLIKDTGRLLVLTTPSGMEKSVQQAVLQLLAVEGVKGYRDLRLWTHVPQVLVGSIRIQATQDANEQHIIRSVNNIFTSLGVSTFSTQVEKDGFTTSCDHDDSEFALTNRGVTGIDIIGIGPVNNNVHNPENCLNERSTGQTKVVD